MDTTERRSAERRPTEDNRATISWDEGSDTLATPARLIDISRGGARFVAESPVPPGRDVCLRLEAPSKTGWILAHVVRSEASMEGGLSFSGYYLHHLIASLI